jgi:hypothetical protein
LPRLGRDLIVGRAGLFFGPNDTTEDHRRISHLFDARRFDIPASIPSNALADTNQPQAQAFRRQTEIVRCSLKGDQFAVLRFGRAHADEPFRIGRLTSKEKASLDRLCESAQLFEGKFFILSSVDAFTHHSRGLR